MMREGVERKRRPWVLIGICLAIFACLGLLCLGGNFLSGMTFGDPICGGSGNVISEERSVRNFDTVILQWLPFTDEGQGKLIITQGDQESLILEGNSNLVSSLETSVNGRTLKIWSNCYQIRSGTLVFHLTVKELKKLDLSTSIPIEIQGLHVDHLEIVHEGYGGDITVNSLNASNLVVTSSGSGDINVSGQVDRQEITLSSSGNYQASDLESQGAVVQIEGTGGAIIWVRDRLEVTISGDGDVGYYDDPTVTQNITGEGILKALGNR